MYDNNCPMADINKAAHKVFIKTFLAFEEEYRNSKGEGTDELAERMYLELTKWLVNHIPKVDDSSKDCVPSKQHLSLR